MHEIVYEGIYTKEIYMVDFTLLKNSESKGYMSFKEVF